MRDNLAVRQVETSGITETRAFTIQANGKAFKVLIDGLYADKIKAVVRELWSNAFDAHIAVGKATLPFDCQLPTVFEPTFRVRDYGVSLSHEDVMGLYTTVFASTKDGTNKQVGKLGLGSKSPFAYVDTFSVTAWLAGEKRVYSAYIGEDYVPQIALMSREPSEEETGLEVAFPCQSMDVDAFVTAVRKVAMGFKIRPNIIGRQVDFIDFDVIMSDEPLWWLVKADHDEFDAGRAYARQGCVVYPIEAGAIPGLNDIQAAILRSSFFIDFPIGDLEIAASREALGYNTSTCRNIVRAADLIIDELRSRYQAEIAAAPTYWEACKAYERIQHGSLHDGVKKAVAGGMRWRGRKLLTLINLQNVLEKSLGKVAGFETSPNTYGRRKRAIKFDSSIYTTVAPAKTTIYFEDPEVRTSLASARVRYHFDTHVRSGSVAWFKADPKSFAWKRVYVEMGRPPLVDIATLEKPPVEKGYGQKKPVSMRQLNDRGTEFTSTMIDEDDDIVYVQLERGNITGPRSFTNTVSVQTVEQTRRRLVQHDIISSDVVIIGVPQTHKNKIARNPHWRCLWQIARDAIAANYDERAAARAAECHAVVNENELEFVSELSMSRETPERKGPLYQLLRLFISVKERAEAHAVHLSWGNFNSSINPAPEKPAKPYKVRWQALHKLVEQTYPLVRHVGTFNYDNRKELLDYVNLIDARANRAHVSVNAVDTAV